MARKPVCDTPIMFDQAPEVCGGCGNLLEAHTSKPPQVTATLMALWGTMLRYGYVHDYYSGQNRARTAEVRTHMAHCKVDFDAVHEPRTGTVYSFADTEGPSNETLMLTGDLSCTCGYLTRITLVIDDMTCGQLLWHALNDPPITTQAAARTAARKDS